jgi:DMSO/TMAO reductase YedYZ molybdopterin-dependent catalytic subunit
MPPHRSHIPDVPPAPLRLVTPLKYGIKQIKQIGRITYTDQRPRDYWYEHGYDYSSGLLAADRRAVAS